MHFLKFDAPNSKVRLKECVVMPSVHSIMADYSHHYPLWLTVLTPLQTIQRSKKAKVTELCCTTFKHLSVHPPIHRQYACIPAYIHPSIDAVHAYLCT